MGTTCIAHRHASLVPLERHHVWPLGDGGPNIADNLIDICCNGHFSIHSLLDLARKHGSMEAVPWETRRRYGPTIRRYATLGWDRIQRQAM